MSRNRKNQSAAIRFGPAIKACLICLAIVICCVGYVWQKKQIGELADQIRQREAGLLKWRDQNDKLRKQLAVLMSPQSLEAKVKELNLGLGPPQATQIWWLPEPRSEAAEVPHEQQYAADHLSAAEMSR
jgi:hypothetical protein